MQNPSELEQFLQARASAGLVESQGQFTLERSEALRKIAEYQLPFPAAWAVKIIQAIVAGGSAQASAFGIRVELLATEIRFHFLDPGFSLDEIEERFPNPQPSANRALRHLLSGLWAVGLRDKWGFQVAFPGQSTTLLWDGESLSRVESRLLREHACISLAPLQQKSSLSWVGGVARAGERNAEILLTLIGKCYACPLRLTVDGRRVDSLLRAGNHGWSRYTCPIQVGFADAPLPNLAIPPGTFEGPPEPLKREFSDRARVGWRSYSEQRVRDLPFRGEASLAFILCINLQESDKATTAGWDAAEGPSTVYWVLDGAVVGEESLLDLGLHCSVGCFLSAEGLQTDLSTFDLLSSAERDRRLQQMRESVAAALELVDDSDFDLMVTRQAKNRRFWGGVSIAVGAAAIFVFAGSGLGACIVGGAMIATAGSQERSSVRSARDSLQRLREKLRESGAS